ncbi:hypothetical protein ACA29_05085 [Lederbergia galactosidilytica]|uniref:Uncharacterized protein n=1 Tax=Lederbergia galactosidilytica TaxID=217031 RepID=A0A0Q9Y4H6_9BACI|nr:hypothetical protein ACA29_05085 [Lederbergia galactosidilytica]
MLENPRSNRYNWSQKSNSFPAVPAVCLQPITAYMRPAVGELHIRQIAIGGITASQMMVPLNPPMKLSRTDLAARKGALEQGHDGTLARDCAIYPNCMRYAFVWPGFSVRPVDHFPVGLIHMEEGFCPSSVPSSGRTPATANHVPHG